MSLIQEVELRLDDKSRERLAAAMRKAGHEIDEKLAREIGKMSGPAAERLARKMEGEMTSAFDRIKGAVGKLGATIIAAFAIQKVIAFGKSLIVAAMESEAPWARLDQTLRGIGVRLTDVRGDVDRVVSSLSNTRFDDEAIADTLGTLIQMSGNYAKSLAAVSVVADLAAAKNLDLNTAAMLVGKAMNGNTELLQRHGIFVQKGADAVEQMRKQFKGFAEAEGKTFAGQVAVAGVAWDNFKEALGLALIDVGDGVGTVNQMTKAINWLTQALEGFNLAARHRKEIELIDTQQRIKSLEGGSFLLTKEENLAERTRLAAHAVQLEAELRQESNNGYADRLKAQKILNDQKNNQRLTEEQIAAALKAQIEAEKAKADAWARALPVWAATRQSEVGADNAAMRATPMSGRSQMFNPAVPIFSDTEMVPDMSASIGQSVTDSLRDLAANPPGEMITAWGDVWSSIAGSSAQIGDALLDAWGGALEQMKKDAFTLGDLFQGLGNSIAKSLIQGVAAYGRTKTLENVAEAIEAGARALSQFAKGNAAGGILLLQSAAKHVAAATAWSALGGAANSASMGSTSRGGIGSGWATGANTKDSLESERRGNTYIFNIDGVDPSNPKHGDLVLSAYGAAAQRHGDTYVVNGRRQG